jgi:hypothetical protein
MFVQSSGVRRYAARRRQQHQQQVSPSLLPPLPPKAPPRRGQTFPPPPALAEAFSGYSNLSTGYSNVASRRRWKSHDNLQTLHCPIVVEIDVEEYDAEEEQPGIRVAGFKKRFRRSMRRMNRAKV